MLIKLVFKELFEGQRVRVVGVYYDGYLDDSTGVIPVRLEEAPSKPTRIDVIGVIEDGILYAEWWREIDLDTELRRRKKALELLELYIGDVKNLLEEAKRRIIEALKEGGKYYNELWEELRDSIKIEAIFRKALDELLASGEILEIEAGYYTL